MGISGQEYAQGIKKKGDFDLMTKFGTKMVVGEVAREWDDLTHNAARKAEWDALKTDEDKLKKINEIIEKVAGGNGLLKSAGTNEIVERFGKSVFTSASVKPSEVFAYMDETAALVHGKNNAYIKEHAEEFEAKFNASAQKHLGLTGKLMDTFFQRLTANNGDNELTSAQEAADKEKKKKPVMVESSGGLGGNDFLLKIFVMFLEAITGISLSGIFGGSSPESSAATDEQKQAAKEGKRELDMQPMLDAAARMRDGKAKDGDLNIVWEQARAMRGEKDDKTPAPHLSADEQKKLGQTVLDDSVRLRAGELTEKGMGKDIMVAGTALEKASHKEQDSLSVNDLGNLTRVVMGMAAPAMKPVVDAAEHVLSLFHLTPTKIPEVKLAETETPAPGR